MTTHLEHESPRTLPRRSARPGRRAGYVVAMLVNAVLLYLINVAPGWEVVPFLTADLTLVLGIINASLIASLVVNLVYVVADPPRIRAAGDLVTLSIGIAAMARLWSVFPFDFGDATGWETVTRTLLVIGIVGSGIGILVALVQLVTGRRGG
jgi:hypothetical protein